MAEATLKAAVVPPPVPIKGQGDLAQQVADLNRKVDVLVQQVGYLHHRAAALEELKDELVLIARDAIRAVQVELGEIEHEFNTEQVVSLLRRLLRSTPRLVRLLQTMENVQDLVDELGPMGKEVMRDLVDRLQTWEERGYFRLARGGLQLVDNVATHATQEDIDRLAANVTLIIDTIKRSTQPELLAVANNAVSALDAPRRGSPPAVGMWGLLRAMRDPEIQVGVGILFELLRQVARTRSGAGDAEADSTSTPPARRGA